MHPDEASALSRALGVHPAADPVRLTGGLLNHVFRVPTATGSVILKVAPSHVASNPEIPLDPARLGFEVRALLAVRSDPALRAHPVRVPEVLAHAEGLSAAILEDLGPHPRLRDAPDLEHLRVLAAFLRDLHDRSRAWDPAPHDNLAIQHARKALQYDRARDILARWGRDPSLAEPVEALGERLLLPGRCLVMGDLWPPSVLVLPRGLGLIDWELSHFGVPAQDLGHLVAHLVLGSVRSGGPELAAAFLDAFGPLDADTSRDLRLHASAEILARVDGPFATEVTPDQARALVDRAVDGLSGGQAWR